MKLMAIAVMCRVLIINMDLTGIVLLGKTLILMLVMKVNNTCSGMLDKLLFYYTKWVDYYFIL